VYRRGKRRLRVYLHLERGMTLVLERGMVHGLVLEQGLVDLLLVQVVAVVLLLQIVVLLVLVLVLVLLLRMLKHSGGRLALLVGRLPIRGCRVISKSLVCAGRTVGHVRGAGGNRAGTAYSPDRAMAGSARPSRPWVDRPSAAEQVNGWSG
jgi:hypothetical protein